MVAWYPCIMIISHLDTRDPAPCHRPVASCTIFFCRALFHPASRQLPEPPRPPSFTDVSFPDPTSTSRAALSPTTISSHHGFIRDCNRSFHRRNSQATSGLILRPARKRRCGNSIHPRRLGVFDISSRQREPFIAFPRVAIVTRSPRCLFSGID